MDLTPPRAPTSEEAAVGLQKWFPGGNGTLVPVATRSGAIGGECYNTVRATVAERGGEMVLGWALWLHPTEFIEAEAHAVWRTPEGKLVDPSFHPDGDTAVYFVPDAELVEPAPTERIPNKRLALSDNPMVADLVAFFEIRDAVNIALQVEGTPYRAPLASYDARFAQQFDMAMVAIEVALRTGQQCVCGGSRPYAFCHRQQVRAPMAHARNQLAAIREFVAAHRSEFLSAEVVDVRSRQT